MEHRWGNRVSVDVPVGLRCRASAEAEARIVNISRSGALIRTHLSLTVLARVDIHLNGHAISSFVTRVESAGIGVEWCEPSPKILRIVFESVANTTRAHSNHIKGEIHGRDQCSESRESGRSEATNISRSGSDDVAYP